MSDELVKMSFAEWEKEFKPMWPEGPDLWSDDYAELKHPERERLGLWTVVEAEGNWYITSGFHFVDRLGYILTEVKPSNEVEVLYLEDEGEDEETEEVTV